VRKRGTRGKLRGESFAVDSSQDVASLPVLQQLEGAAQADAHSS